MLDIKNCSFFELANLHLDTKHLLEQKISDFIHIAMPFNLIELQNSSHRNLKMFLTSDYGKGEFVLRGWKIHSNIIIGMPYIEIMIDPRSQFFAVDHTFVIPITALDSPLEYMQELENNKVLMLLSK